MDLWVIQHVELENQVFIQNVTHKSSNIRVTIYYKEGLEVSAGDSGYLQLSYRWSLLRFMLLHFKQMGASLVHLMRLPLHCTQLLSVEVKNLRQSWRQL